VVERTFGWLVKARRLVRDHERNPRHHEALVYIAMIATAHDTSLQSRPFYSRYEHLTDRLLKHATAQEQSQGGDDRDGDIDGEADLSLAEGTEDDAENAAGQNGPLQPAEEGNESGHQEQGTDQTDENRDDLHGGANHRQPAANTTGNPA
jgi:hypothetical protein